MSNLKELEKALVQTQREVNDWQLAKSAFVKRERQLRVAPLQEAVERETRAVLTEANAQFDASIDAASERAAKACIAFEAAKVAHVTQHTGWHPVGTKLVNWDNRWGKPVRSGSMGVVEIWTHDSEWPENKRWGRPGIGDVVVRILKKDGTPSKNAVNVTDHMDWARRSWLPEGEEPKKGERI